MLEICTFAASNNPTYDGAKEYFFIDVVDDRDYLSALNFFNPHTVFLGVVHLPLLIISLYSAILSYGLKRKA